MNSFTTQVSNHCSGLSLAVTNTQQRLPTVLQTHQPLSKPQSLPTQ